VPDTTADCSDLETELGYSPKVNVEQGVANFVCWYKDYFTV
jgi:UDP-glucuronate 4-epimerase